MTDPPKTPPGMPKAPGGRALLMTMTREPFQPVRLYYAIPGRSFVTPRLRDLHCVVEAPAERCLHWLFHAEAAALPIGAGYDAVPEERRPIVLGRIRFPKNGGMTIQTNSADRAIAAARFFAPYLGPEVVLMRFRVVNRLFAAEEGPADQLFRILDQEVTVIDPRAAEAEMERDFQGVKTMRDAERVAAERLRQRLESRKDVPMVEDFPLAPEEETPEFKDLAMVLHVRLLRALAHWKGNTDVTLTEIIVRMVEEGGGRIHGPPALDEAT